MISYVNLTLFPFQTVKYFNHADVKCFSKYKYYVIHSGQARDKKLSEKRTKFQNKKEKKIIRNVFFFKNKIDLASSI
jgi:hypothetical protein